MKHKVSELEGTLLDLAVAKAEGLQAIPGEPLGFFYWGNESGWFNPSSNWSHGGPIIESNDWLLPYRTAAARRHLGAYTSTTPGGFEYSGPTPLIAAMRAYVASKFGEEVEL